MTSIQMDKLLDTVVSRGASDLHLHVGQQPTLRLSGRLRRLETKVLEPDDTVALLRQIAPERALQELQEEGSADFGFAYQGRARFRCNGYRMKGNVSIVLRQIPTKLLSIDEIGLPPMVKSLCSRPRGMFLVTGPTGSGKTTTLASMINFINMSMDRHIITIEDPIEYYHDHKMSIVSQREVGSDVPSFAEALRRALREDPDVVLVGEMRDLETIAAAIRAAETGHLVFGTLHTTGAAGTINRLIDAFPVDQQEQVRVQLATSLIAVISQVLCPRASGKGMVAAYEYLYCTNAVQNLIRENKTFRIDSSIQTGKKYGMQLLDEHLLSQFLDGTITEEEAIEKARSPADLQTRIEQIRSGKAPANVAVSSAGS